MLTLSVPTSTFLFSIDVDSLYTNIETKRGLAAIKTAFQRSPRVDRLVDQLLYERMNKVLSQKLIMTPLAQKKQV